MTIVFMRDATGHILYIPLHGCEVEENLGLRIEHPSSWHTVFILRRLSREIQLYMHPVTTYMHLSRCIYTGLKPTLECGVIVRAPCAQRDIAAIEAVQRRATNS